RSALCECSTAHRRSASREGPRRTAARLAAAFPGALSGPAGQRTPDELDRARPPWPSAFVTWGVLMAAHEVAYLARVLHEGTMDWRRNAADVVAGARSRRALLVGAVLAGVVPAAATLPAQ